MGIKKRKPVTSTQRYQTYSDFSILTKKKPEKSLLRALKRTGGRGNMGRITSRHRGGGAKRMYRIIDFKRDRFGVKARVSSIEYDPNRSCWIALIEYADGKKNYIIAPHNLQIGDEIISGPGSPLKIGNTLPLKEIPLGTEVHNVQLYEGAKGTVVRAAGASALLSAKEGKYVHLKLPSGEVRAFMSCCLATVGSVSNPDYRTISLGKAGRSRHKGIRPQTRGSAMNPVDHPMGGGEGKSKGHIPQSPTGIPAKGFKTRKKRKSSKYIIKRRK